MSLYKPERKSSPEKLERARLRAQATRDAHKNDPEWHEKRRAASTAWRAKNLDHLRDYERDRGRAHALENRLRRKGLDPEVYMDRIVNHSGECDICSGPQTGRWQSLDIDHCHVTGRFRGMLCGHCNRALGLLGDNPDRLRRAILYLENIT